MYKERTRSLLSISYVNQHWEFAMDLLQTCNFARGWLTHRIRHTQRRYIHAEDYLDLTHHIEPLHTRRKRTRGEHISDTWRRGKSKSFIAFHVQSNRHIFQSKTRISTKQYLRLPRVHRGVIKLCFTHENFPPFPLAYGTRIFPIMTRGWHVRLVKYGARETCAIHSRKSRTRSHRPPSLRRFQSR